MATQKGIGVVWGIGTTEITAGTGRLRHTGQTLGKDTEISEHRNEAGDFIGVTSFAGTQTLELEVYPAGVATASGDLAKAVSASVNIPTPGSTVSLTDSADTDVAGTWYVTASSKRRSNTDKVVVNLSLKRWNTIADYTTVS